MQVISRARWIIQSRVVVFVAVVGFSCASTSSERAFRSPDATLEVRLHGSFGETHNPFVTRRITATLHMRGSLLADVGTIYDFDSFDASFDRAFPRSDWPSRNAFRLSGTSLHAAQDTLVVQNQTAEDLRYIFCDTGDLLVIANVPKNTISEYTSPAGDSARMHIHVRAQTVSGGLIERELDLDGGERPHTPEKIAIKIQAGQIRVYRHGLEEVPYDSTK